MKKKATRKSGKMGEKNFAKGGKALLLGEKDHLQKSSKKKKEKPAKKTGRGIQRGWQGFLSNHLKGKGLKDS